jgi:REP element-mobilizing transposase RayT
MKDKKYHADFVEGQPYHIIGRGNNGDKICYKADNYQYFLDKFATALAPYLHIYAYAILNNHYHIMIRVRSSEEIEAAAIIFYKIKLWRKLKGDVNAFLVERFQRFLGGYAQAIKNQEKRSGSIFEKSFQRIFIDTDNYWYSTLQYIHHNPIHHHLVANYNEYKYTSYNTYFSANKTGIERDFVLNAFGGLEEFRLSHQAYKENFKHKEEWDYED